MSQSAETQDIRLNVRLDEATHRAFKSVIAKHGLTIQGAIALLAQHVVNTGSMEFAIKNKE